MRNIHLLASAADEDTGGWWAWASGPGGRARLSVPVPAEALEPGCDQLPSLPRGGGGGARTTPAREQPFTAQAVARL